MPSGVGTSPLGTSIAGYGSFDVAPVPQQVILIDALDGNFQNSRKIDPRTGQYVYDSTGRIQGMRGIQQLVLLRAKTLLNSSAVFSLGMGGPGGVIGVNVIRRLTDQINAAMKDLVDAKLIEVVEVRVERDPNSNVIRRLFKWRDLTAATPSSRGAETITQL